MVEKSYSKMQKADREMSVRYSRTDRIICVLLSFMIMSFYIFEMASWGRYILFALSLLITLVYTSANGFRLPLIVDRPFHLYVGAFALFSLISALWAWNPSLAVSKAVTIFSILLCFSLIYPYFVLKESVTVLIDAFMLAGYGITIYTLIFYGTTGISAMLNDNIRVGNDFTNANSIGLIAATSCVIQFYYLLRKEKLVFSVFVIPCIVVLAISQSRKAIVMLVIGIAFLIMTNGSDKSSFAKKIFKIVLAILSAGVLIFIMSKLRIFQGVLGRFSTLFESMEGQQNEDIRAIYRRIGMQQFLKTPVLGIGMGNSLELLSGAGERRTYLHCNYVELLASGGIIGFAIYYWAYAKLLIGLWRYRYIRPQTTNLCIVLLALMLIMDYGMVTYYDKQQYLYLMCFFLQLDFVKKDSLTLTSEMREGKK